MIIICPHCYNYIEIIELNCCIFRHGTYKLNNKQINPHLKKEECVYLIKNNLIYGCGKPFQIIINKNEIKVIICDYI
jgi:hypothetical protein